MATKIYNWRRQFWRFWPFSCRFDLFLKLYGHKRHISHVNKKNVERFNITVFLNLLVNFEKHMKSGLQLMAFVKKRKKDEKVASIRKNDRWLCLSKLSTIRVDTSSHTFFKIKALKCINFGFIF